ncbi:hypothetical protein BMS3Abin10_00199 [bacterium BMS3Abin10]|nr:hypothetical protein BMS3Abin10_00199 [bacterium BMS3Abin10]GBE39831.1 hypothetical protein BMS3Bbin08_02463 [bacterium BMS3Bbin08]
MILLFIIEIAVMIKAYDLPYDIFPGAVFPVIFTPQESPGNVSCSESGGL